MSDPLSMAEGAGSDALDQMIAQAAKKKQPGAVAAKNGWQQTNVRLEPGLKEWAKKWGQELGGVPLEDIVWFALGRLRADAEAGKVRPNVTPKATRSTLVG